MRPLTHAPALSMGLMAQPNYNLHTAGVAVGLYGRLELSYAWQGFDTQNQFLARLAPMQHQVMTR